MADDHRRPLADVAPVDVQATFCSTLVDQWIRLGVRHAVVAPGSRSTPMAIAVTDRPELRVHVVHDERVAAFVALGLGLGDDPEGSAAPALLLCTSGTAAANFLPAVAEAGLSAVPMIVLTADRPEELRGVGAPQTIDQHELYGTHTRWFHDPGVPEAATADSWRALAVSAWTEATAGPVQLNLPFREPLVGTPAALPDPIEVETPEGGIAGAPTVDAVPDGASHERGVILVGGRSGVSAERVLALRAATGWPIIADPQSGMRRHSDVTTIDALLRVDDIADRLLPDVIVRIGRPSTSKVLAQWTARNEPLLIQVGGPGRIDPSGTVAATCEIEDLIAVGSTPGDGPWIDEWRRLEAVAVGAIDEALAESDTLTEPSVARLLCDNVPDGAQVAVSSSMPVRDVEWYGGRTTFVHSNRGANGIDGVASTALGRALAQPPGSSPSFLLIGDLAFVHDSNSLVGLVRRGVDLRIVVVDNDGGGIFSFLPQSTLLAQERFEQLFGTPLGTDVLALAAAHGVSTTTVTTRAEFEAQLDRPGPWVCRVPTDRQENVAVHAAIHAAVATAVER